MVHTASRNGSLLATLKLILDCASPGVDLYLLKAQAVLADEELRRQHAALVSLLAQVDREPRQVRLATRVRYEPAGTAELAGFKPIAMEVVYPSTATVDNGWVCFYSEDEVRSLIAGAHAGPDPRPAHDDDGESLAYVFGFLKSHVDLLQSAMDLGHGVAYAEMNPAS